MEFILFVTLLSIRINEQSCTFLFQMSRYRKPLTHEELLHLLENDDDSDIPDLSDDDLGWDENWKERDEDINPLLDLLHMNDDNVNQDEDHADDQEISFEEKKVRERMERLKMKPIILERKENRNKERQMNGQKRKWK